MSASLDDVKRDLDAYEKSLRPGQGQLDLGLVGQGTLDSALIGARAEYAHRINKTLTAIASGELGALLDASGANGYWKAMAGLRWRF